jgi:hypothetical protein
MVGFKIGHTFDVSQTDGAPIPNPINMALAAFAKEVLHIDVELVESDNPNWGGACSYDQEGHPVRIVVAGNRSPLFRAQTLAHELAHALLHSDKDYRAHIPRSRIECEAESVAFCILNHFGLDVGGVAFGYLAQRARLSRRTAGEYSKPIPMPAVMTMTLMPLGVEGVWRVRGRIR